MYCKNCGAEIDDEAVLCPKCGIMTGKLPAEERAPAAAPAPLNIIALIGFIFSFIQPIPGLICSIIGKKEVAKTGERGEAFAKAGLIISIVELSAAVLSIVGAILFYVIMMVFALIGASSGTF